MTASSNSVRFIDYQPSLYESSLRSPACVIEFFETPQRLLTDLKRIAQETEIDRLIHKSAIGRGRYVGVPDPVEEALYWLISAAVFGSLALGIFGL